MKNILSLLVAALILHSSCRKEDVLKADQDMLSREIKQYLKDSLAASDFNHLSFSKANTCNYANGVQTVMVPFDNDSMLSKYFVALKTEADGGISAGKIIMLSLRPNNSLPLANTKKWMANGEISISSLNRSHVFRSPIVDGYITALHPDRSPTVNGSAQSLTDPYQSLPEVIVVAYVPSVFEFSSSWFNLLSMLGSSGNATYYQSLEEYGYGGGGGGGGGGGYTPGVPMLVDFENDYYKDAIDISKYIKCFDAIPDAGSMTSITIMTDIPVDGDPSVILDWANGSPGHTFVRLNKSNGTQHVQQVIGFYPKNGWKTAFIPDPIEAKFIDNGQHEFNASIRMTLSPQDFRSTLNRLQYLADFAKYDIDEFNCTDLALDLFNHSRGSQPLTIPTVNLPGGNAAIQSNTPQGLFQELKTMKLQATPEARNISLPAAKAFEGVSNGPCN